MEGYIYNYSTQERMSLSSITTQKKLEIESDEVKLELELVTPL